MKTGTETIEFIKKSQVSQVKTVTYARVVAELIPQKAEPERVRIILGGNILDYLSEKRTPTT